MYKKAAIVIPLDGSQTATAALGAAQAVTTIMGAVLHIVHVAEARLSEDQLLDKLKAGPLQIKTCLLDQVTGDPANAILDYAESINAKMIVMSSHGWTYNREYLVGSTAMDIIQGASMPILVIRPGMINLPNSSWKPIKMLCPLNGSPMAAAQMQLIFEFAKLFDADVDVLNVAFHGKKRPTEAGTITVSKFQDYPHYDMPAWADEFIRRFCVCQLPGVKVRMFQLAGDPSEVIIRFASENKDDLIVLSWRGRLETERAQTIKGLLRKTEMPVLLLKPKT